jgi:hypothetical protein
MTDEFERKQMAVSLKELQLPLCEREADSLKEM